MTLLQSSICDVKFRQIERSIVKNIATKSYAIASSVKFANSVECRLLLRHTTVHTTTPHTHTHTHLHTTGHSNDRWGATVDYSRSVASSGAATLHIWVYRKQAMIDKTSYSLP